MSDLFRLSADQTILGPDGNVVANGQVHFYDRKSGAYAPVYGDAAQKVSLRQPVQADSAGVLPPVYLDDSIAYRAVVTDRQNDRIREIDDVRRHREGIKVLTGVEALKRYCGEDPFVLVASQGGCPVFYKRLSGCDLPEEHLPDVVRAECGCDCSIAWQVCRNEPAAPDICAMETAELNCDHHVLVQECRRRVDPSGAEHEDHGSAAVKKASIGSLLSAAAKCLPRACIAHDAPELALVDGGLVQGDREPPPLDKTEIGATWGACIMVVVAKKADKDYRHLQLNTLTDLTPKKVEAPQLTLTNKGPCLRRYEIRALNRLNRAREHNPDNWQAGQFHDPPIVNANFQTRLGIQGDPWLDDVLGPADYPGALDWLIKLSIADSTMGPFNSGHGGDHAGWAKNYSTNGYTENNLIVDLKPGDSVTYVLKYHIYWDMNATPEQLKAPERIHFGTRIVARQVR